MYRDMYMGLPGPLWAGPLGASLGPHGPGPHGPHWTAMGRAPMGPPSLMNEIYAINLGVQGPLTPFYETKEEASCIYMYIHVLDSSVRFASNGLQNHITGSYYGITLRSLLRDYIT